MGVWAGMSLLSAVWFCFDILVYSDRPDIHDSGGARVFRLLRFALIMYLGICCQIYAWRQSRVNFPFIFKIKSDDWPRNSTLFLVLGRVSTCKFTVISAFIAITCCYSVFLDAPRLHQRLPKGAASLSATRCGLYGICLGSGIPCRSGHCYLESDPPGTKQYASSTFRLLLEKHFSCCDWTE